MINKKQHSSWWLAVFILLFAVNIRVEADLATGLERIIDGLVSGMVVLVSLYYAGKFFGLLPVKKRKRKPKK